MKHDPSKQHRSAIWSRYFTIPVMVIGIAILLSAAIVPGGISGWLFEQEIGFTGVIRVLSYQPRPGSDHLGSANARFLGKAVALVQLGRLLLFCLMNLAIASLWIGPAIMVWRAFRPKPTSPAPMPTPKGSASDPSSSTQTLLDSRENSDLI
ncbi:hypothetical protein AB1K70_13460 [Bremerella sp. JC770]|uniref:hypothetical protein n=1 Tax=Bremerella sp. JC770 TaxID=3232137 RepID=UPI003457422A